MRKVDARTSNLPSVVHLTKYFGQAAPLSSTLGDALSAAFEQGWADPKKLSQAGSKAAIMANQAIEEIAQAIGVSPSAIEPLGEPALGHYLSVAGLLHPELALTTSTIDLGKVRAVARSHQGPRHEITVDSSGRYLDIASSPPGLICLQAVNGETGVAHEIEKMIEDLGASYTYAVDATHAIPDPDVITGATTAVFDASAWSGPSGMGFLVINNRASYRYPLPHIAPISAPGSYSLPLLIVSALALDIYKTSQFHIANLRSYAIASLQKVSGITVVAADQRSKAPYISFLIDGFAAEEVLARLTKVDISIEAGSACSPEDLTPSHVIAAMGYPTQGHLRITLHPHHSEADIDYLAGNLAAISAAASAP